MAVSGGKSGSVRRRTGGGAPKRALDLIVASAVLVVLSPIVLCVALVVRSSLGRPVLFRQHRPGLGGDPFEMVKFRTMTDERSPDGELLPDHLRRHPVGLFLRRTSLDELPTLINVVRGDMSLVGPRPLMMEYLPRYTSEQMRRHEVRPGMTGLAQTRGRNATTWAERLASDIEYVDHRSFGLDLRILWATIGTVFGGGADALEDPQLGEFLGVE